MSNDTDTQIDRTGPPCESAPRRDVVPVRVEVDDGPSERAIVLEPAGLDRLERAHVDATGTSIVDPEPTT